jgi:hypothetical protein
LLGKARRGNLVESEGFNCGSFGRGYRGCSTSVEAGERRDAELLVEEGEDSCNTFSRRLEGALVVLLVQ